MKTSDFIKKVEYLGYYIENRPSMIYVKAEEDDVTGSAISMIHKRNVGVAQIVSPEDLELFQLIADYASTPLEKREGEATPEEEHDVVGQIIAVMDLPETTYGETFTKLAKIKEIVEGME